MRARDWVGELANAKFDAAFNPYADVCPVYDLDDAPRYRRLGLLSCVEKALEAEIDAIWVARDLGHRGGRRTGLALTDDVHLPSHAARWSVDLPRRTKGAPVAEGTASVIWKSLDQVRQPIFLWNVFPLHPHEAGNPLTNRAHTAMERDYGLTVLDALVDLLAPRLVIAIGGDAYTACTNLGLNPEPVRHPSYGGAQIFSQQIRKIYAIPEGPAQARLF